MEIFSLFLFFCNSLFLFCLLFFVIFSALHILSLPHFYIILSFLLLSVSFYPFPSLLCHFLFCFSFFLFVFVFLLPLFAIFVSFGLFPSSFILCFFFTYSVIVNLGHFPTLLVFSASYTCFSVTYLILHLSYFLSYGFLLDENKKNHLLKHEICY